MTQLLGIVGFVVALLVSVTLHEAGHALTARRFGMKVSRFFVGFGPTLWSFRRGETEYGVKALPLGGFAKIEGMSELEEQGVPATSHGVSYGAARTSDTARTAEPNADRVLNGLEGSTEGLKPGEEGRAFFRKPAPQRAVVLSAGSIVHFIIAIVLVYAVVMIHGSYRASEKVGSVAATVPVTIDAAADACTKVSATCVSSPAQKAGLRAGDRVVSLDGTPITSWDDFTQRVRDHGAGTVTLVVSRDGRQLTLRPDLVAVKRDRATGAAGSDTVGAIGLQEGVDTVHYGPLEGAGQTFTVLGDGITGVWGTLTHRIGDVTKLFSKDRDPNGLVGVVGASRVSGDLLSAKGESWGDRIASFVLLVAGINLTVGLFNLLPLLPLDGGHLAILGFEQARQGVRRLRGYRGPVRKVDMLKLMPITYAVAAVLIVFTVVILSADIVNPVRLNQ